MTDLEELTKAVIELDSDAAFNLTQKAIDANIPANDILAKGLVPGLKKIGDLFEEGEYFLPELILAGHTVSDAVKLLEPILATHKVSFAGKLVIGTVHGDLHDLGKNIVIMMFRGNGWHVADLGINVPPEVFCSAVEKGDYDVLGMSVLLTSTMPGATRTIEALETSRLRDKVKIIVGGAPTTQEWANKIGADGWAEDALRAVKVAADLVGTPNITG